MGWVVVLVACSIFAWAAWGPAEVGRGVCSRCGRRRVLVEQRGKLAHCRTCALDTGIRAL